jgi:hypothetical protein
MRIKLLLLIALGLLGLCSEAREIHCRIPLKPGQSETSVKGRMDTPSDWVLCAFTGRSGQHFAISLHPGKNLVAQMVLLAPSGKQEGPGTNLTGSLTESGTYHIRITPREQTWGGFKLHFQLTG